MLDIIVQCSTSSVNRYHQKTYTISWGKQHVHSIIGHSTTLDQPKGEYLINIHYLKDIHKSSA